MWSNVVNLKSRVALLEIDIEMNEKFIDALLVDYWARNPGNSKPCDDCINLNMTFTDFHTQKDFR